MIEIKKFTPTSHKIKAVVYGASGAGKTYFAATAPMPIFASAEAGLLSTKNHKKKIDAIEYVDIKKVEDLRDLLTYLQKTPHHFKTVVIDSISEINEIIKEGIEKKRGSAMIQKDWGDLFKSIKGILRGFRDLDMHVIFIAQEKSEKDDQKTEKVVPMLNGKAATEIAYFMDIVAYCYVDKNGDNRITVHPSEKLLTKCRGIELPPDAPDDFELWIAEMEKIEIGKEETRTVDLNPPKAPEPPKKVLIQPETSKALYAEWNKFYKASGKPANQNVAALKATLKKEFSVETSRALTDEQAKAFTDRLKVSNKKIKDAAKEDAEPVGEAINVDSPEDPNTPPPQEEQQKEDLTGTQEQTTIEPSNS